jgi:multimeric flavodoxin WrbA
MSESPWAGTAAVFACSPRPGGNSDLAASLLRDTLAEEGRAARGLALRDVSLLPCVGCQSCTKNPEQGCVLAGRDQADQLFAPLLHAPALYFCSPIYYYHVPAGFKAFIDRGQAFYARAQAGDPAMRNLPRRTARAVLVAGRPRGEKLFEGSLLTLKYFLQPFNVTLGEPLLLRGQDAKGDLAGDHAARALVEAYARAAAADA